MDRNILRRRRWEDKKKALENIPLAYERPLWKEEKKKVEWFNLKRFYLQLLP